MLTMCTPYNASANKTATSNTKAVTIPDFYHPGDEGGVLWSDPEIGIDWPIPEGVEPILSEKDKKWLGLKDTFHFE